MTATTVLGGDATRVQSVTRTTTTPPPYGGGGYGRDPYDESRSRWLVAGLIALLVALAVLLFFVGRSLGWWDSAKTLTVPADVVGKPVDAATAELHQRGFSHVTTQPQVSSQVPSGDVINTNPPPGSSLRSDKNLTLLVSSGPVQVKVPDVTNQPVAAATAALQAAGFKVTTTPATSATVPQGSVISTSPAPGASAAQGSVVKLVVSSGKQQVTIPSLVGQSPSAAGASLAQLHLVVGSQNNEASTNVPSGEVTRTDPPAGSSVAVGSSVTVFVSTGPPQVAVPDLTNDTMAAAQSALKAVGLVGKFTNTPVSDKHQDGIVQSQDPTPNTTVDKGSTVNVVIGSFKDSTTTSSTSTTLPGSPIT